MIIQVKVLNKEFYRVDKLGGSYYDVPSYQTTGSAGMDLRTPEDVTICPNGVQVIRTGLAFYIQDNGYAGMVLPRSGLGSNGLILANTVGLIDSDYQGELIVNVWNRGSSNITLKSGDRFAQFIIIPVVLARLEVVEDFNTKTQRLNGGFGSTGK